MPASPNKTNSARSQRHHSLNWTSRVPADTDGTVRRSTDISGSTQQRLVVALIILATLHALLWSFVREPGSGGPDESNHFSVVAKIVANGALAEFKGYADGAFSGGPVRAQVAHEITPNLFAVPVALTLGLIGSDERSFNIHIARLFMVALYPITLWLAFLTLRRVFLDMRIAPVWGVAVMATVPMFTLVHTYYTNDAPAIAASTFATYALVRASQSSFAQRDTILLGASLGLVGLHKYTGVLMFPATAFLMLWHLFKQPIRMIQVGSVILGIATAIASWWYIRNWILYGDPIGVGFTQAAVDASGGAPIPPRTRGLNPVEFVQETNWIGENFATSWAGYGLQRLKLPGAAYLAFSSLIITAFFGAAFRITRAIRKSGARLASPIFVTLAGLHVGLWLVSFWSSYTVDVALNGRYVFPTFLPFIVMLIFGLSGFVAWRGRAAGFVLMTIPVMLAASGAYFVHTILPDVNSLG